MYVSKIYRKKVKHLKESSYLKTKAATKVAVAVLLVQILVHPCFSVKVPIQFRRKGFFLHSRCVSIFMTPSTHPQKVSWGCHV